MAQMLAKNAAAASSYGQLPPPVSKGSSTGFPGGVSAVSMQPRLLMNKILFLLKFEHLFNDFQPLSSV